MIDNNGREDTIKILSDHQLSCMTFIISIQLEDSIIVAADKRNATVDYEVLSDESKKLYTWKNGIIAGTGEETVISRAIEFFIKLSDSNIENLPKCLKISRLMRELEANHFHIHNSKMMYSEYTETGAWLTSIEPNENGEYKVKKFEPNSIILSFFNPDVSAILPNLQVLYANLKPYSSFENQNEWINYYLSQLCQIFKKQANADHMMSRNFDVFFQTKDVCLHEHIPNNYNFPLETSLLTT